MSFKTDDKVRHRDQSKRKYGDGKIVAIDKKGWLLVKYNTLICVMCDSENCGCKVTSKWYRPINIEYVVKKNQQLLFSFME